MMTAQRRAAANDEDGVPHGVRFAMTSNESRTVHAVVSRNGNVARCGRSVAVSTYGEEGRLPLCRRCRDVVVAETAAEEAAWDAEMESDA